MADTYQEHAPDYMQDNFTEAHLIFTLDGKTDKEAAAILLNIWQFNNAKAREAWDRKREDQAQAVRDMQEHTEQEAERLKEELKQARQEEQKKNKNKFLPISNNPLPSRALLIIPQHAINKTRKGEYT
ncbi:hypothetical protein BS17DRAFT_719493 [Gyrodon lividus]|nr:hypothetical protein BS17DRAFT_719493 [Gyrodon lividus]